MTAVIFLAVALVGGAAAPAEGAPSGDDVACGRCHEREWTAWQDSRHAHAAFNPLFQADMRRTPRAWCASCHAPGVSASRVRYGVVDRRHGVRCTTCHLDDEGVVLSATHPTAEGRAAHAMRHAPALSDERACARCHEFARPGERVPLQETASEWRGSAAAARGETRQDCHMKRGHTFGGAHDRALLARSSVVDVTRRAGAHVEVRVRAPGVAHRAPTGDLSRALRVSLCATDDDGCARPLAAVEVSRRFRVHGGVAELVDDTTVSPGGERRFLVNDDGRAARFVVDYWYAPALAGELPDDTVRARLGEGAVDAGSGGAAQPTSNDGS